MAWSGIMLVFIVATDPDCVMRRQSGGHEATRCRGLDKVSDVSELKWWAHQDSNLGPTDYEPVSRCLPDTPGRNWEPVAAA